MNNQAANLNNNSQEIAIFPNFSISCSCHIINPKVHRLILWKEVDPETKEEKYTLRLGSQRFTSLTNLDKNGQTYWRFKCAGFFKDETTSILPETINKTVSETTNSAESSTTNQATNE